MKVIAVDLDGVLCEHDGDYSREGLMNKKPIKENIEKINKIFLSYNHIIVIYTARKEKDRFLTEAWLKENGVYYHYLSMSKPYFDVYIDEEDKAINITDLKVDEFLENIE